MRRGRKAYEEHKKTSNCLGKAEACIKVMRKGMDLRKNCQQTEEAQAQVSIFRCAKQRRLQPLLPPWTALPYCTLDLSAFLQVSQNSSCLSCRFSCSLTTRLNASSRKIVSYIAYLLFRKYATTVPQLQWYAMINSDDWSLMCQIGRTHNTCTTEDKAITCSSIYSGEYCQKFARFRRGRIVSQIHLLW